jgi:PHD finger-like domain-containing protein 5A
MSRHHPDLVMCRKQAGIAIGRLCDKCDGKCPVCDSYVRPTTLVRICDECSFGNYQNKCVVCGGEGISDAFYCHECTRLEKDRDGCPKIINLGSSRTDVSCPPPPPAFFPPAFHPVITTNATSLLECVCVLTTSILQLFYQKKTNRTY